MVKVFTSMHFDIDIKHIKALKLLKIGKTQEDAEKIEQVMGMLDPEFEAVLQMMLEPVQANWGRFTLNSSALPGGTSSHFARFFSFVFVPTPRT